MNLIIYGDGGSRGNPGPAAAAFVVHEDGRVLHEEGFFLGETTNNVAEYTCVIKALEWMNQESRIKNQESRIIFYLDSELVVKQLMGIYKIKSKNLIPLARKIKEMENDLAIKIKFVNVPREKNTEADLLVNQTLDARNIS